MIVFHILEYICSCVLKDTRAVDFKPIDNVKNQEG